MWTLTLKCEHQRDTRARARALSFTNSRFGLRGLLEVRLGLEITFFISFPVRAPWVTSRLIIGCQIGFSETKSDLKAWWERGVFLNNNVSLTDELGNNNRFKLKYIKLHSMLYCAEGFLRPILTCELLQSRSFENGALCCSDRDCAGKLRALRLPSVLEQQSSYPESDVRFGTDITFLFFHS